jgi:hypothetical protein
MEFFIEMNLFKDELHEQMKLFLANGHGDGQQVHNDTEFDHLAPLGAYRHIDGLEQAGIDPNSLDNLALFCVLWRNQYGESLGQEGETGRDPSVGWCSFLFPAAYGSVSCVIRVAGCFRRVEAPPRAAATPDQFVTT